MPAQWVCGGGRRSHQRMSRRPPPCSHRTAGETACHVPPQARWSRRRRATSPRTSRARRTSCATARARRSASSPTTRPPRPRRTRASSRCGSATRTPRWCGGPSERGARTYVCLCASPRVEGDGVARRGRKHDVRGRERDLCSAQPRRAARGAAGARVHSDCAGVACRAPATDRERGRSRDLRARAPRQGSVGDRHAAPSP